MTRLTIVIGYRDRGIDHMERCLASLARQSFTDFELLFVDYGSSSAHARRVANITEKFSFCRYIYSDTRGHPWNRSRALNIGIRQAKSDYVMTSDVDMLFPDDFLKTVMENISQKRMLYCPTYYLPQDFKDWANVEMYVGKFPISNFTGLGGCLVLSTAIYRQLRGFDEYYCYWGVEDRDLNRRLLALGIEETWLTDHTCMFHQWHPAANHASENFMPDGLWGRAQVYFHRHIKELVRNSEDWGCVLSRIDRPVFEFLDPESGLLRNDSNLVLFNEPPDDNNSSGKFVSRFLDLPTGQALIVKHTFFPKVTKWNRRLNKFLNYVNKDGSLGWRSNRLHAFIAQFIEENSDLVVDYYLGFPDSGGISLIVRA